MSERIQQIWDWFSGSPLRILLVIAGALFTQYFGGRAIDRAMARLATADLIPVPTPMIRFSQAYLILEVSKMGVMRK